MSLPLSSLSWRDFERLFEGVLRNWGFQVETDVWYYEREIDVLGKHRTLGVYREANGGKFFPYVVAAECKRWNKRVPVGPVEKLAGLKVDFEREGHLCSCVIVTIKGLTLGAQKVAYRRGIVPIVGERVEQLISGSREEAESFQRMIFEVTERIPIVRDLNNVVELVNLIGEAEGLGTQEIVDRMKVDRTWVSEFILCARRFGLIEYRKEIAKYQLTSKGAAFYCCIDKRKVLRKLLLEYDPFSKMLMALKEKPRIRKELMIALSRNAVQIAPLIKWGTRFDFIKSEKINGKRTYFLIEY